MQQARFQRSASNVIDGVRTFVGFPVVSRWIELDLNSHDMDRRKPRVVSPRATNETETPFLNRYLTA